MNRQRQWRFVIAYDTPDNRRRREMVKLLEQHAIRRQKSVFEADLTAEQMAELWQKLATVADPVLDQLNVYRCCEYCLEATMQQGPNSDPAAAPLAWVV